MLLLLLLTLLTAFLVSYFLIRYKNTVGVFANPNERTLHDSPTPRTGGIAIVLSIITYSFLIYPIDNTFMFIISGLILVALISFVDDMHTISPVIRLIIHFLASFTLIKAGFTITSVDVAGYKINLPAGLGGLVTTLFIIWLINLYNFMDGIDGIAAGMAISGFTTFAVIAYIAGNIEYMAVCLVLASASLGFLIFNFPPAKIFMGDIGASSLGFLLAAMSLWAYKENIFPIVVSVIAFSPFIIDATVTIIIRIMKKERVWEAHNNHYYQRLVKSGLGHRDAVLWEYGLMLISAIIAVVYFLADDNDRIYLLAIYVTLYSGAIFWVHRVTRNV